MGRIQLSICAVVLAVGLAASAEKLPERQEAAQKVQAASDQRAQIPTVTPPISERRREAVEDQGDTPAQPSDVAERDLKAQQAMALIAALQLLLTGLGIWYIRRTLVETEKAVKEASDATDAARKAVTETSRVGEAQVRAYLSVIGLNYTAEPEKAQMLPTPEVEIVLNNSGATPAINIAHYCGCTVSTHFLAREFSCPEIIPFTMRLPTVPANATESRDTWCHGILNCVDEYEASDLLVGPDTKYGDMPLLIVWGSVLYDDVFGASYRSDYAFIVYHRDSLKDHPLAVAEAPQRCFQPVADRRAIVRKPEAE